MRRFLKISTLGIFFGIILLASWALFSPPRSASAATCSNPSPALTGFAAPCPIFSLSTYSITQGNSLGVTLSPDASYQYIWGTMYLYNGSSWVPLVVSSNYLTATTNYTIPASDLSSLAQGTYYLASWDWTWNSALNCYVGPGSSTCNTGDWRGQEFTVTASQGGNPPIVLLSADPLTVTLGQSVTLTWSTQNNPTSCTASGNWSGSEPTSGSTNVTPGAVGTAEYSLTCSNANGNGLNDVTITVLNNTGGGGGFSTTLFGMHANHYTVAADDDHTFPPVTFGSFRLWGTATTWQQVNTAPGTYDFSNIDSYLSGLHSAGVQEVGITLAPGVPAFARQGVDPSYDCNPPNNSTFCVHPSDLNPNGTGTNNFWDTYIVNLAQHIYSPAYLQTHAKVTWWEPWNEWSRDYTINNNFTGALSETDMSYAQMVRMTQDMRCILKGTPATSTLWPAGETCQGANGLLASLGLSGPIDPSALILTPSTDGLSVDKNSPSIMQNFLYCTNASKAAPYYCTTGDQGSQAVDVINSHFYMTTPENIRSDVSQFVSILDSADQAKPFWSNEGSWGPDGQMDNNDLNLETAFVARYYLIGADSGANSLNEIYWYSGDLCSPNDGTIACPTNGVWQIFPAGAAFNQVEQWMVGASPSGQCTNNSDIWTCNFTRSGGYQAQAVWDAQATCNSTSCPYSVSYTDSSGQYLSYKNLAGATTAIPQSGANAHQVMIGARPILLQNTSD